MATVETSATRHNEWVKPKFESIRAKKQFFERYWQNIELVGTFHSHPYKDVSEVRDLKGWQASDADKDFWPYFHEEVSPEQELMTHLIITITKLTRKGWALPDRLKGSEETKGYTLSSEDRKMWLRAYASHRRGDEPSFCFADDMDLQVSALHDFHKWA